MEKEVRFFGFSFSLLHFGLLCFGWTFFLCFIWPLFVGSYFFVSVFVCAFSVVFAGIVTSRLVLGLIVLLLINRKIVLFYQNFMLLLSGFLGTWVFSWFVKMGTFIFLDHLIINTFTVFMYYRILMATSGDYD
jgi:hypothetical protein